MNGLTRTAAALLVTGLSLGCSTLGTTPPADGAMVKQPSPSSGEPRAYDCAGANQEPGRRDRKDCLPNRGDEAARDTVDGTGKTGF